MLFATVFRAFNVHIHIVTTKGGRKRVAQHFPKDQRTLCFIETPRATILQKPLWQLCSCNKICIDHCTYIGRGRKVI